MSDFDGDNFDHSNLPFLRGGTFAGIGQGFQPIVRFGAVPPSVKTRWGAEWKKAAVYWYDRVGNISFAGEHIAYKDHYMDLDPTYKDHLGDPLLRLTLDWRDNERQMVKFVIAKGREIARAMGAKEVVAGRRITVTMTAALPIHARAGRHHHGQIPRHSVVNTYGQHWQAPNLFVMGASMLANNGSANPTPTVIAFTYRTADAVIDRYLKSKRPGIERESVQGCHVTARRRVRFEFLLLLFGSLLFWFTGLSVNSADLHLLSASTWQAVMARE